MRIGGGTTDEALRNVVEAVQLWAEDAIAEGAALPDPRSAETLRADPEIAEAIAEGAALAIVPLLLDAGRPAKANLSIDAGLLAAIDDAAEARSLATRYRVPRERRAGEDRKRKLRPPTILSCSSSSSLACSRS